MRTTVTDTGGSRRLPPPRLVIALMSVVALVGIIGPTALGGLAGAPAAGAADWSPVLATDFPDPSVLAWNGTYYAFATQGVTPAHTTNVQVATSADGVHWVPAQIDALPTLPAWAARGNTWAPSVAYSSTGNDFVMYLSLIHI